jgi:vancomycin resistance protein YoaR
MNKMSNKRKAFTFLMAFLLLIFISLAISYSIWNKKYRNSINPGIQIGKIDLSGLTLKQAEEKINAEADRVESAGVPISYNDQQIILPANIAVNSDLSFPVFIYNREETLKKLLIASPQNSFFSYFFNLVRGAFLNKNIDMVYFLDEERIKSFVNQSLKEVEIEPLNAAFAVNKNESDITFVIEPERVGRKIDFESAFNQINEQLRNLSSQKVPLKTITSRPTTYTNDLESLRPAAEILISRGDLKLTLKATTSIWTVKKETLASWIVSEGENGNYRISLDKNKIEKYITDIIAPKIDQEAKRPKYEMVDGKMSSWQTGANGQKLNIEASATKIKEEYLINNLNLAELVLDSIDSELSKNTDIYNIQEIIGTGHSKFSGSPANRRHNIKVGADAVNGILIAPGEEFSLVKALGEIDAKSGYLPELVIKNNKTIPEYGGGLCQVGTTIFRSALMSGLPITARQNHSYRVSYYEPAGTDAAIYDPWPDVRFLNDSGNYILIQSRIVKDDIYFDFWGKKDGRVASSTYPVIYNITKPAPTKIVETTDLKPGEKKCTEKAHNGADAYFDYSVTYLNGDVKNNRFKSHYVPWQEVCLIGKSATSTSMIISSSTTEIKTATSTN